MNFLSQDLASQERTRDIASIHIEIKIATLRLRNAELRLRNAKLR